MCGRYTLTANIDTISQRFKLDAHGLKTEPRYNIAPSQEAPVIVVEDGKVLKMMRWGLIPSWAKDESIASKTINARAETLHHRPSFKKSLTEKRCLVPADGFYEWKKEGRKKIPIRFVLKNRDVFAFAGLWDTWRNQRGELIFSFTIITTQANDLIRPIHDRMPVILKREYEELWLDPEVNDIDKLLSLLIPYPPEMMEAYRVSSLVNSPKEDSPECIKPVG
ncbi:Putative SOS response-associated peptidase YedK [bacterium HR37]|nr:Putative SOS response-associated peptidase YedK [bacterium HR37]